MKARLGRLIGVTIVTLATPGVAVCGTVPAVGCRLPTQSQKAQLQLRYGSDNTKNRLSWKWAKGAATSKPDSQRRNGCASSRLDRAASATAAAGPGSGAKA